TEWTHISNTAKVLDVTAKSIFVPLAEEAGKFILLPIDLSVNSNGLPNDLSTLEINAIRLTYILSNRDLLDFENRDISQSLVNQPAGWHLAPPPLSYLHDDTVV